jgi:hypothetical protein
MSTVRNPPPKGGIAWPTAIVAAGALALGVGMEFFWAPGVLWDFAGASALIGAGAVTVAALAGHGLRLALRIRTSSPTVRR